MASDAEPEPNGVAADASMELSTPPRDTASGSSASQVTLPSTEIPASPIDPTQSFATEPVIDDDDDEDDDDDDGGGHAAETVIPSSLTPPPSTQVAVASRHHHHHHRHNSSSSSSSSSGSSSNARRTFSHAQPSSLFSPPATVPSNARDRGAGAGAGYVPPTSPQMLEASPDELRAMLQTCVAELLKVKMETAHHRLQYNLLSLQADEDSKRAAVEHDMARREVDALRLAEHSRQARRDLVTSPDSTQAKYLQMKLWYEEAMEDNVALNRRLKAAKKVIQQKEDETLSLAEERDMLLTRIRENREHFHMLCSPGGIFHSALTPKQQPRQQQPQPQPPQHHRAVAHGTPRSARLRDERDAPEHGLSALLQAMSQDNNSAPSTPSSSHRAVQRYAGKHSRNAQSMSSLPTTPLNRTHDASLLPSVDLVPQTEPRMRHSQQHFPPSTPTPRRDRRRKSRESTISVEDNEELARQAVESAAAAAAAQSIALQALRPARFRRGEHEETVVDSQASQAATAMLRRSAGPGYDAVGPQKEAPGLVDKSARMLLPGSMASAMDKRKFGGGGAATAGDDGRREQGSPTKKMRVGGPLGEEQRVGLGIQYGQ